MCQMDMIPSLVPEMIKQEEGYRSSGGQKQRSMLARCGTSEPPILSNGTKALFFGGLAAPELVSYLSPGTTEKRQPPD